MNVNTRFICADPVLLQPAGIQDHQYSRHGLDEATYVPSQSSTAGEKARPSRNRDRKKVGRNNGLAPFFTVLRDELTRVLQLEQDEHGATRQKLQKLGRRRPVRELHNRLSRRSTRARSCSTQNRRSRRLVARLLLLLASAQAAQGLEVEIDPGAAVDANLQAGAARSTEGDTANAILGSAAKDLEDGDQDEDDPEEPDIAALVHDWLHSIGFEADSYGRTHNMLEDGHHNVVYGNMKPGCRAQKYRAPHTFPEDHWLLMLLGTVWGFVGFMLLLIVFLAQKIYEIGLYGRGVSLQKMKFREQHRLKSGILNIFLVATPVLVAFCFREWRAYEDWHDRREIMILTVMRRGFNTPSHQEWLASNPYNFLAVDCANLEVEEFTGGPSDAWTLLPLASWALDHTWKNHKYVYWADPSLINLHRDIHELSITAHEHMDKERLLVVDERAGLLLSTGALSRHLLDKARILCKSPVEHPLVALLALAVGGANWTDAVNQVAQRAPDGGWDLLPLDVLHAKVLPPADGRNATRLPSLDLQPWC
ncbi:unnamed protein product [Amoebophrya sp. A25]|nr:unnamed protein product [Amoebophrya sp. A25]|eukprot:GSA25T00002363001.1